MIDEMMTCGSPLATLAPTRRANDVMGVCKALWAAVVASKGTDVSGRVEREGGLW